MTNNINVKPKLLEFPTLIFRTLLIFIRLSRGGFLSVLISLNIPSVKFSNFLKIVRFILERRDITNKDEFIVETLAKLGPGFIKFGQALSTRPDLLGTKITKKLINLQDKLEPFSSKLGIEIIENEFGLKISQIFKKFNNEPIAAASVAQVFCGTLISGEKVAIKILRPDIEKKLFSDFKFFYFISYLIESFKPRLRRFKLKEMVTVFAESSLNEIDLRLEASSSYELKANFKNYKKMRVPKVYWDYTTKKVLCIEYIEGFRIDALKKIRKTNIDIDEITKVASEIFFLQVFRDGFFHADLHPGNILIDDKGIIVPLDFGIMGRLSNNDRRFLSELLTNLLDKKFSKVTELHDDYNMIGDNVSRESLTQEIRAISIPLLDKPLGEISLANLMGEILSLSKKFNIEIQPQFCLLQKTMVMAEGIARQLNPKTNMWELTKPLVETWIKENHDPFNIIDEWISKNKKIIEKLPEFFHKIDHLIEKLTKK